MRGGGGGERRRRRRIRIRRRRRRRGGGGRKRRRRRRRRSEEKKRASFRDKRTHLQVSDSNVKVGAIGLDSLPVISKVQSSEPRYLLYLGRIGKAKRSDELVTWVINRWEGGKKDLRLKLAGKIEEGFIITDHPAIEYCGIVKEEKKYQLIGDALAIVNPSRYESLSLIVLEALLSLKHVLVSSKSDVLKSYASQLKTVTGFCDEEEFRPKEDKKLYLI